MGMFFVEVFCEGCVRMLSHKFKIRWKIKKSSFVGQNFEKFMKLSGIAILPLKTLKMLKKFNNVTKSPYSPR